MKVFNQEKTRLLVCFLFSLIFFQKINAQTIISGNIHRNSGAGVPQVLVEMSGDISDTTFTDLLGNYIFGNLLLGSNLILRPQKDTLPKECVSVRDLILIEKHISSFAPLPTPYQIIAADANKSNTVTTFDITETRKLILGISNQFPNNTSWRFVPEDYVFPNPQNPFSPPFPDTAFISNLQILGSTENFIGMKIGDASDCAGDTHLPPFLTTSMPNLLANVGNVISIPISVNGFANVAGLQFSVFWNTSVLKFQSVDNLNLTGLSTTDFNLNKNSAGEISLCWSGGASNPVTLPNGSQVFQLQFLVVGAGISPLNFVENPTPSEVVDGSDMAFDLGKLNGSLTAISQPPTIFCPPNLTVGTDLGTCFSADSIPNAIVTSSPGCSNLVLTSNAPPVFPLGISQVIFTANDNCGISSCSMTVTVLDNEPPILICPPTQISTSCGATLDYRGLVVATDNCSPTGLNITQIPAPGTFLGSGLLPVTMTATDQFGNMGTCVFNVLNIDIIPPTLVCPQNMMVATAPNSCVSDSIFWSPVAADDCLQAISVVSTPPSGTVFQQGLNFVFVTATDSSGNFALPCFFTVEVADLQPPVVVCPPNISVNTLPGLCQAIVPISPDTLSDNCFGQIILKNNAPPGFLFPLGATPVSIFANDLAGNFDTCFFTVTVMDNQIPTLVCPPNITANTDLNDCTATLNFTNQLSIFDNCPTNLTFGGDPTSGQFPVGNTPVNLIANDGNGNISTCQTIVQVIDNQIPSLVCPPAIIQPIDPTGCVATVTIPAAVATDNCILTTINPPGAVVKTLPIGNFIENFTATDAAGNTANCSVNIAVTGVPTLAISCPADVVLPNDAGECFANFQLPNPTVTANCGLDILTNNAPATFPIGKTTVVFLAKDVVGATASCATTVTVNDFELPILKCQNDTTLVASTGNCQAPAVFSAPKLTDNCPTIGGILTSSLAPGTLLSVGKHTVNYFFSHPSGQNAACSFAITVLEKLDLTTQNLSICEGETVEVGGQIFSTTGNFSIKLSNLVGCDSLINLNLKVNPKPTVEILGPPTICPTVGAVISTTGNFTKFSWSGPGGFSATTQSVSINLAGNYVVSATDANGCTATDSHILVENCGSVKADFAISNDTICTDFGVSFSQKSVGGIISWHWDFGDGTFSDLEFPVKKIYSDTGFYTVRLTVSDGFSTDSILRKVLVYKKLSADFQTAVADLCNPKLIDFSGSAASIFSVKSWNWDFGDGTPGNGKTANHQFPTYLDWTASLWIEDEFGCRDSLSKILEIKPNGFAPLPVDKLVILCPGEKFTLNGTVFDENKLNGTEIFPSFHGCDSIVNVQLSYIPGGNISLGNDTTICENESVTLVAPAADKYLWSTGETTKSITISAAGIFSVNISGGNGNCEASGEIKISVDTIPNIQADAGSNLKNCEIFQFVQMNAENPAVGTGEWTGLGTALIDKPASPQSFVSKLTAGKNQFVWTLSNGTCKNYDRDTVEIEVFSVISEMPFAGDDVAFCQPGDVQLDADLPTTPGLMGFWSQPQGQNLTFSDPTNPKTKVFGLNDKDIYLLFWNLSNDVCPSKRDEVFISHSTDVLKDANAGADLILCNKTETPVIGNMPGGTTGKWSVVGNAGNAVIGNEFDPTTVILGISPGILTLVWTLATAECGSFSSDTISIFQSGGLKANNDVYKDEGQPLTGLNLLGNDEIGLEESVSVSIISTSGLGSLTEQSDGTFDFIWGQVKHETVGFRYRICLKVCPNICSEATVKISTEEPVPAIIRPANVLTANGDGIGDLFEIPNFYKIPPPITLTVFNRWGDLVFRVEHPETYKNDWIGVDNYGNELPEGTYYFIFRGGGGDGEETGNVTILR